VADEAEGDPYAAPPRDDGPPSVFNTLTVPESMTYPSALSPAKDTFAPLEIDVLPHHILNRRRLKPRELHRDFIELLHKPLDPDEKLVPAVAELWEDERRRRSAKGLSLSEKAMMPGSGGMGGRSKAELGYLEPGEERKNHKGGDWKISDELWGMIEERMSDERRKRGRLTFDRFSSDVRAGKDGEKLKYDKVSERLSMRG
jgi:DNA polymerase zeta